MIKPWERMVWETEFKNGTARGFKVTDTHTYISGTDKSTGREQQDVDAWMETPFTLQGKPVMGYAVVPVRHGKKSNELRDFNTVEFHVDGHNLDYMTVGDKSALDCMTDKDGKPVDVSKAREEMGRFAAAASEYPHVVTLQEYVDLRTPVNARMKLDPPNEDDYHVYLDAMERQLRSRDFTFVGAITSVRDLHEAHPEYYGEPDMEVPEAEKAGQMAIE